MVWNEKAQKLGLKNSHIAQKENRRKRIEEYNKNPKICKRVECNNIIPYKTKHVQKFCSHICSSITLNIKRRIKPILFCKNCNKQLSYYQRIACSKECRDEFWLEDMEQKITHGEISKYATIRRFLIKKYDKRCWICKITEWMGKEV